MTKPGTLDYTPSRSEARTAAMVKSGLPHVVIDRGDMGMMWAIVNDWTEAATTPRQRELALEMQGFLHFLRLQLDK